MADYLHGVQVVEINEGTRYIRTIATAVIGMVVTAPDADDQAFPLNTPVRITNIRMAIGKAGTQGTLLPALNAIALQASPIMVVVRVEEGETEAQTTSNVVGTVTAENQYTGLQALLVAQAKLNIKPRIIGAPGLDTEPVITAMVSIAQKLRAFVYAHCEGETISDLIAYREKFGARELMLIDPDFTGWDTKTDGNVVQPATAYALGLRAKIDNEQGWHRCLSNVAVNGPTGISKERTWDLQDMDTDAGLLNSKDITTLVMFKGARFWGCRTTSADTLFAFESATRTGQIMADTIAEAHFAFVDSVMTPANVQDIVESVGAKIRQWVTEGKLLGGRCWYDPAKNTNEQLKAGQMQIDYEYTPVPPMEGIQFNQMITDSYFGDFNSAVTQG